MKAPFQISDATLNDLVELALDAARALGASDAAAEISESIGLSVSVASLI